jgi:S1-C subfamily serine protease
MSKSRLSSAQGAASFWIILAILVVAGIIWFEPWKMSVSPPAASGPGSGPAPAPRQVEARGSLAEDEQNNISVFRTVSPSVVHITTVELARSFLSLDVMQIPRGTGSGFIWDDRGNIVTNFHVIQGASAARVTLSDQSNYRATLVGAFPDRDLAVLRIDAPKEKLRAIVVGGSGELQVGQKVYAIGNPFGLDQTLTTGVISALNREIESVTRRPIRGMIQTDAAINPGNSGGPLLDSAGRLIGVNTAIYSPTGSFAGIGFAIPVDEVNRVVPRLIRDGKFVRPALGIQPAPQAFQRALGLGKGIAIVGVLPDSPAAKAGIRPFMRTPDGNLVRGDVIVALAGKEVATLEDLQTELELRQPGETVAVTVARGDKRENIQVRLGLAN